MVTTRTFSLFLAVLAFVSCGTAGKAGSGESEFRNWLESGYRSEYYQQDGLKLVDPKGDAHLIRKLDTIPVKLFSYLVSRSLPQALPERERRRDYRIGKDLPVNHWQLLDGCARILRLHEPAIIPTLGEEHRWSPDAKRYMRYGFWHRLRRYSSDEQLDFPAPLLMRSKLLLCLACGWSSRYCVTGREEALKDRILCYPDRSVRILDLFEESYVLNDGNVYLTLLTCENVLAGQPHRIERDDDPLQRKLCYIRHDSRELGDNYGAWYHFFGTALYGLVRPAFVSRFVADTESVGSLFYEGPDRQEYFFNHAGAVFGHKLKIMLEEGSWRQ